MNEINASALAQLKSWFEKAENWQKDMFCQFWQGNEDLDKIKARAFTLAKDEYIEEGSRLSPQTTFPASVELSGVKNCPVILESLSEVQGVGALSPTRPLTFSPNLTIVYGENGCGKSSYARILKSAASPKSSGSILGNVFKNESPPPSAKLIYSEDGIKSETKWKPNASQSCPLNIYDTSVAKQFAEKENEVIYEPRVLSILTQMVQMHSDISQLFEKMIEDNALKFSSLPEQIQSHELICEFKSCKSEKAFDKFMKSIEWNEEKQKELEAIKTGLGDGNPQRTLTSLEAQKRVVTTQYNELLSIIQCINDDFCTDYLRRRKKQIDTKREADTLMESISKISALPKTGSDKWKSMWIAARNYVNDINQYSSESIDWNGKCALCQQEISSSVKERIDVFSEYLTSDAMRCATQALESFESAVKTVQTYSEKINIEQIETQLRANNLTEECVSELIGYYKMASERCGWLLDYTDGTSSSLPSLPAIKKIYDKKTKLDESFDLQIKALQSILSDRESQLKRFYALAATKWIYQNSAYQKEDILLQIRKSKCKTNALTTLKKNLTDLLITDTYISRFQSEMQTLDIDRRIRVELISKGAKKGRSYHQVSLKDAVGDGKKKSTSDILSEGEYRVVSLAAFLADLSSWDKLLPFIFDDPITSLDHKYEKRVADRLVKLSCERQVIVFTHRLAFAELLSSSVKRYNDSQSKPELPSKIELQQIELRNMPLGEPMDHSYSSFSNLSKALSPLKQDIERLKKQRKNQEYEAYDSGIQALCSKLRKIVEHGIETDLLSGIVTRFSYSVQTLKLNNLHAINSKDINLFDDMMTKYSSYEHSQSLERPVSLPELEDIEKDIEQLLEWYTDFNKRRDIIKKNIPR